MIVFELVWSVWLTELYCLTDSTVSETAGNPVKQVREGELRLCGIAGLTTSSNDAECTRIGVEIDVLTGLSPRPRYPSVSGRIRRRKSFRKDKPITFTIKRKKEKPSQRKVKY